MMLAAPPTLAAVTPPAANDSAALDGTTRLRAVVAPEAVESATDPGISAAGVPGPATNAFCPSAATSITLPAAGGVTVNEAWVEVAVAVPALETDTTPDHSDAYAVYVPPVVVTAIDWLLAAAATHHHHSKSPTGTVVRPATFTDHPPSLAT